MKTILLTFDYELFLKKSGTLEKCLLEPTDRLITFFNQHNIKATFFVDVLYYLKLCESNETQEQKTKLEAQLRSLIDHGHRIELHLHPNWQDAVYANSEWTFPHFKHYRLHHCSDEQIHTYFLEGLQKLEQLAKKSDRNYRVLAFRAGGWCLQPFSKLKQAFLKAGLKIDSSVAPRISRLDSEIQFFDFKHAPNKEYYFFKNDPLKMAQNGDDAILEIPISTYPITLLDEFKQKNEKRHLIQHYQKNIFEIYGDGIGLSIQDVYGENWKESFLTKLNRKLTCYYKMFSLQDAKPEFIIHKINQHPHQLVNFLSHPKSLSESSFILLDRMLREDYDFSTLKDIYEEIR